MVKKITLFDAKIEWLVQLSDKYHIAAINFEAGDHAMPQNPLEIDLALRAAKVAWERYPYLEHRYGERGRRFTDSDSCWLVTLTRAPRAGRGYKGSRMASNRVSQPRHSDGDP